MTYTIEAKTEGMSIIDVNRHLAYFQEDELKLRYLDRVLSKRKLLSQKTQDSVYNVLYSLANKPNVRQEEISAHFNVENWKCAGTLRNTAEAYEKEGKLEQAFFLFEKLGEHERAKKINEQAKKSYRKTAQVLGNVGLVRKLKSFLWLSDKDADENAAYNFMKAGDYDMAIKFFKKAGNRVDLVDAYEKAGKHNLARQVCEEIARSADCGNWELDPMALRYYERAGNVAKTIELHKRIKINDPKYYFKYIANRGRA